MGDYNREYASKGVAGAGLGTGIAGLSLGVLNSAGGLLGGFARNGWGCNGGYGAYCNNYQQDVIAQQASEIAFYRAKSYSDETGLAAYKYVDGRLREIEERMHSNEVAQTAFNSTTTASLNTLSAQLNDARATLASITRTAVPSDRICDFNAHSDCCCKTSAQ